jgi:hypothetical protein
MQDFLPGTKPVAPRREAASGAKKEALTTRAVSASFYSQ